MVRQGQHICVVTPTASGKTMCYNLPVLDAILKHEGIRALYIFPTKALAQDQLAEIEDTAKQGGFKIRGFTLTGYPASKGGLPGNRTDNHHQSRYAPPNHTPHHPGGPFIRFKYVVVDEMHNYRAYLGAT